MSGVLYRLLCEEVFRAVVEELETEDPGDFPAMILLLPPAAGEKGISGIFRFFCLIGEKKKLTGTFGCKIRHLFFEM